MPIIVSFGYLDRGVRFTPPKVVEVTRLADLHNCAELPEGRKLEAFWGESGWLPENRELKPLDPILALCSDVGFVDWSAEYEYVRAAGTQLESSNLNLRLKAGRLQKQQQRLKAGRLQKQQQRTGSLYHHQWKIKIKIG